MSEYFPIEPIGLNSAEVESFSSYCCRLAIAHSLSTGTLITHLRAWWKRTTGEDGVLKTSRGVNQSWNSYSPTASEIRRIVEKATATNNLDRSSFASLAPAAPVNCLGLLRRNRAWCPACMSESKAAGDTPHDRLLWTLPNITRCPAHKVTLQTTCFICGCEQKHYHATGETARCWKCSGSLLCSPKLWTYEPKPSFCEAGTVELVREISAGSLIAVDGAFQIFAHQIRSSLPGKRRGYGTIFGSDYYKHVRRERMAPTFTSMLQQSQALGVSLVQILSDPVAAAGAAGELALASQVFTTTPARRTSNEVIQTIRSRLKKEIRNNAKAEITSFRSLAREFHVLPGTIEYHLGDLARKHKALRKAFLARKNHEESQRLYQVLDAGLIEEYRSKQIRSIDDLARRASASAHTGIGAARRAISQRLGINWCC